MQELIFGLDELEQAARKFLNSIGDKKVIAFHGEMGAGKTTFIGALCATLEVEDYVSSPTFAIVNEYSGKDKQILYHFDFYRINDMEELQGIGLSEYLFSGNYCFIEWPEIGEAFLPDNTLHIKISETEGGNRKIELL